MSRLSFLLISVLLAAAAFAVAAAPARVISGPAGFSYAQAEIDRDGDGFVAWKSVESGESHLERLRSYGTDASWTFEGYVVKGLRAGENGRVLLQGVTPEGQELLRLLDATGDELRLVWSSENVRSRSAEVGSNISVSRDLRWWYSSRFHPATVQVAAGVIGDAEPRFRWTVDLVAADPDMAVLVDGSSSEDALTLALAVDGEAWLLRSDSLEPQPLVRPEGCATIYTLQGGGDVLWADCGMDGYAIYRGSADGSRPLEAGAVLEAGELRVLADGRALSIDRRRGGPGVMRILHGTESGAIERGAKAVFPAPLGTPARLAGEQVLVPRSGRSAARQVFEILPIPR
jgi:hypothetical protein